MPVKAVSRRVSPTKIKGKMIYSGNCIDCRVRKLERSRFKLQLPEMSASIAGSSFCCNQESANTVIGCKGVLSLFYHQRCAEPVTIHPGSFALFCFPKELESKPRYCEGVPGAEPESGACSVVTRFGTGLRHHLVIGKTIFIPLSESRLCG